MCSWVQKQEEWFQNEVKTRGNAPPWSSGFGFALRTRQYFYMKTQICRGFDRVISIPVKIQTSEGFWEQGFLAELLGYPEEASPEVGCRRGVLGEEGSQAQQARGLPQTLEVLRILGEPGAEHRAHRSAETSTNNRRKKSLYFPSSNSYWFSISTTFWGMLFRPL